jgi:uncharacterized protein with HEPN domain
LPSKKPAHRLRDILDNIAWIEEDTRDLSEGRFLADRRTQDAVLYRLLRICEAATKLTGQADTLVPDQPWDRIRAMGNLLRHGYDQIDLHVIWRIVRHELAPLRDACEDALRRLPERCRPADPAA